MSKSKKARKAITCDYCRKRTRGRTYSNRFMGVRIRICSACAKKAGVPVEGGIQKIRKPRSVHPRTHLIREERDANGVLVVADAVPKCEDCLERAAEVKLTATDLDGLLLDSYSVCKRCASGRDFRVGK